ncbi:O-methyltransferase [Bacillus massilinigeriensis]|uniref:O-methyltransferase n=1 Tax=Bacillus massilionigeriensis TaxID=1805475 RepID=UPI00096AEAA8|nr:O-methyltransferase [Bacillus massilionigeriensis]
MFNEKLHNYIEELIPNRPELLQRMEFYAKEHHVPIMEITGIEVMLQLLRMQQPKNILEVGTAIGYSAIRMIYTIPDTRVVTIERDPERYEVAEQYFKEAGIDSQVVLLKGDALNLVDEVQGHGPYDCIFIDAAKGQYKKFFEYYAPFLNENGIIITDNVLFKGLVAESNIESKRTKNLVKKIRDFNLWLMNHPDYDTVILPVGDGIAISKKR